MKKNALKKLFLFVFTVSAALLFITCSSDDNDDSILPEERVPNEYFKTYTGVFSLDGGINYNLKGSVKVTESGDFMVIETVGVEGNPELETLSIDMSNLVNNGSGFSTPDDSRNSVRFYKYDQEIYCEIMVEGEKGYYFKTKIEDTAPVIPAEYFTVYKGNFGGGVKGQIKVTKSGDFMILEPSVAGYSTAKVKLSDLYDVDGCLNATGFYLCKSASGISLGVNEELTGYNFLGATWL